MSGMMGATLLGALNAARPHKRLVRTPGGVLLLRQQVSATSCRPTRKDSASIRQEKRTVRRSSGPVGRALGLRCDFDVVDRRTRFRDRLTQLAHRPEVGGQSVLEVSPRFFLAVADRRAARHVRGISGVSGRGPFNDKRVTLRTHFKPAFLSIAFSVPGASSFPSWPGTVMT